MVALLASSPRVPVAVVGSTLVLLAILGSVAARIGGAPMVRGAARVTFWGALAMGASALVGRLFGTSVA
jgi:VIT1/CCC1 family predicted Fe2+/Mn2+ transporter